MSCFLSSAVSLSEDPPRYDGPSSSLMSITGGRRGALVTPCGTRKTVPAGAMALARMPPGLRTGAGAGAGAGAGVGEDAATWTTDLWGEETAVICEEDRIMGCVG